MGEIIYGKFGHAHKESEPRDHEYVTLTVTYKENGSVTDEVIEKITGPPNHCGSGFGKRDMGWVFPKENMQKINDWVKELQTITGISIDINLTDADGNPN